MSKPRFRALFAAMDDDDSGFLDMRRAWKGLHEDAPCHLFSSSFLLLSWSLSIFFFIVFFASVLVSIDRFVSPLCLRSSSSLSSVVSASVFASVNLLVSTCLSVCLSIYPSIYLSVRFALFLERRLHIAEPAQSPKPDCCTVPGAQPTTQTQGSSFLGLGPTRGVFWTSLIL